MEISRTATRSPWQRRLLWEKATPACRPLRFLLVGPYDPHCGEYTFLAPPLGVWRLCGYIRSLGHEAQVFDPNCSDREPGAELIELLCEQTWDVVGISTTGMTLRYDLALAHLVREHCRSALLIAGGMEATFDPDTVLALAPCDLVVLGEGEKPLRELANRLRAGDALIGIKGTAIPLNDGGCQRFPAQAMNHAEHRAAIALTPYSEMPYSTYWRRLEDAYALNALPAKAEREARLAEIRSVRVNTLNYCPMACTFCSSTNFLHSAQGSVAKIARLDASDCMEMIGRVLDAQPHVKTIIFQDDIFVFTKDQRVAALCESIVAAKRNGRIPSSLEFISTNRIDAMTSARLRMLSQAGFRVLGFGVESFSENVLAEFNKQQIFRHIEPALTASLELGLKPFLDLILCSPRAKVSDIAQTLRESHRWMSQGCEVGLYPYVIPFSGSKMSTDPTLGSYKQYTEQSIPGTDIRWQQATHIHPIDPLARSIMEDISEAYERTTERFGNRFAHLPSRVRSMLWVSAALPILNRAGEDLPESTPILQQLERMDSEAPFGPPIASVA